MLRTELLQLFIGFESPVRGDTSQLNEICRGSKLAYLLVVDSETKRSVSVLSQVRHKRIRNNTGDI